jgi:NADH dehydrogenase [ubiquinone] 1 alpha subcomplex assembly factor 7
MTPLHDEILNLIRTEGPIPIARYMDLALGHPVHGYYMTRDPFGRAGDFITAPEISQMFGELIGLWLAEVWSAGGGANPVRLVEAGPGRGTLMTDLLRAAKAVPAFRSALDIHLVEMSPVLRTAQQRALAAAGATASWHGALPDVPEDAPLLLVANEFLDALPIRQFERRPGGWHERLIGERDGRLAFGLAPEPEPAIDRPAPMGAVMEVSPAAIGFVRDLSMRILRHGGAALLIDYGHTGGGIGDTLQAMRGHGFVDPLAHPGEADITAHVDFSALAAAARSAGAAVHGPVPQGDFLNMLGLAQRAERLMAGKADDAAAAIASQRDRLTDRAPTGMGALFKVLAITRPDAPAPPRFA